MDGKVRKRTLLNMTDWPAELIEDFRTLLKGGTAVESMEDAFTITRSRAHGHVAAVLGTIRRLKLDSFLSSSRCRQRDLVLAIIVARILQPASKLALSRELDNESGCTTLANQLGLEGVDENDLYAALDWLRERQDSIEKKLAKTHLQNGTLVLYDVSSTYFEGRTCPLAHYGYSRDGKKDKLQIVFGLLCSQEGIPVAVEVFEGNTKDSMTVANQVQKIRDRFGIQQIVLVGDRGMLTEARLREDIRPLEGIEWITALTAPQIRTIMKNDVLQLSLFDEQDLAEIYSPDYPGERLVACRNPLLADERARKREDLLQATEQKLNKIVEATQRNKRPLRGQDKIGVRVGKVLGKYKMEKHFTYTITETSFSYERNQEQIDAEAQLDGLYMLRTSVGEKQFTSEQVVESYKQLSTVEQAFRFMKTVDLKIRPIHHRTEDRVRAHVFVCMLAYYVEWHMRESLAPLLFQDCDKESAKASRTSIVAPAKRSERAQEKARKKVTPDGYPVHSFSTMLQCLSSITSNQIKPRLSHLPAFDKITQPNPLQQRALDLLQIRL
jgi:transposase